MADAPENMNPLLAANPDEAGLTEQQELERQLNSPFTATNLYAAQPSPQPPTLRESQAYFQPITQAGGEADIKRAQEVVDLATAKKQQLGIPLEPTAQTELVRPDLIKEEPEDASQFAIPKAKVEESQVKIASPDSDKYFKDIEKSFRAQKDAYNAIGVAAQEKAKAQAQEEGALAEEFAKKQIEFEQRRADINRQIELDSNKLREVGDKILGTEFTAGTVDPNRANIFVHGTTSQKITAAIAVGLGALGEAAGGKNAAMDMINNAIEKDINAQKENISNQLRTQELGLTAKTKAAAIQSDVLANLNKIYNNQMQAEEAYRILRLEQAKAKISAIGSKNTGIQQQQAYKAMNAQLDRQLAESKMQFDMIARQRAMLQTVGAKFDDPMAEMSPTEIALLPKDMREEWYARQNRVVKTAKQFAISPELAKRFIKESNNYIGALQVFDEIKTLMRGHNKFTDLKDRTKIESLLKIAVGKLKDAYTGTGVMSDSDREFIEKAIGNPEKITDVLSLEKQKLYTASQFAEKSLQQLANETFSNPEAAMKNLRPKLTVGKKYEPKK